MTLPWHCFGRAHLGIFLGFYLAFAGFTAFVLSQQSVSDRRENRNVAAVVGSVSGPFTGAIARNLQSCCWRFSLQLFPWCAALLAVGTVLQVVPLPFVRGERLVRLGAWCVGCLGWFGGGVVSFGHALC
jgi:hypothetical protein